MQLFWSKMFKAASVLLFALPVALGGRVGSDHNKHLECLQQLPLGNNDPLNVLYSLVIDCGFDPQMPTDEFVEVFADLLPVQFQFQQRQHQPIHHMLPTFQADTNFEPRPEQEPVGVEVGMSLVQLLEPYAEYLTCANFETAAEIQSILEAGDDGLGNVVRELGMLYLRTRRRSGGRTEGDLAMLNGIDIARFSSRFWLKDAGLIGNEPGKKGKKKFQQQQQQERKKKKKRKAKWWQIVVADVAGGVVGGIFGGAVGAVGLGTAASQIVAG